MNYDIEIENSIINNIIDKFDIYHFRNTPNQIHFEGLYNFCRENLNINSELENISPNIFIYSNSFNVNAKAGFKNNQNTIVINLGLMMNCLKNYLENESLNEYVESNFDDYIKKFDNPVSYLAFQITTQFTYYHELAHLFQFCKKKNEIQLQERKTNDGDFDIIRHKLEINADTYSSIAIATHLQQYIDKIFGTKINHEIAVNTIKILGACLLNYIINFSDKTEIYFKQHSHPHPFLRLLNIVLNISNHIESMPNLKDKNIILDGNEIFKKIIDFYQELEDNGIFKTKFSDLVFQNKSFQDDIVIYLNELLNFDNTNYEDAMEVWNRNVTR